MTAAASQHLASAPRFNNPSPIPRYIKLSKAERDDLRLRRRRKGVTLKWIAWRIGIDPHLLARYQHGERRTPASVLDLWRKELA